MAVKPISVTQFNSYVKRVLQSDPLLGNVSVNGEISNLKLHGSGHVYFTLKDENSKLSCFLPSDQFNRLRYELADGMSIVATGYISVFERGGSYSLNIRDIVVEGAGNLSIAYESLKLRLEKEGLFDPDKKKEIPAFPKQLAIITSATGAAIRDILKIINKRNDQVDIVIFPCLVQGPDAAFDISLAIEEVNKSFPETDTIIVGRGGGSIEELWAFNEEIVVRSVFNSRIPVISAVGHETDFTLTDYVSDKRAATPSEAAQIAVPDIHVLRMSVKERAGDIINRYRQIIRYFELQVNNWNAEALKEQFYAKIRFHEMKVNNLGKDLVNRLDAKLSNWVSAVDKSFAELEAVNPYSIMERGYATVIDEAGKLVTTSGVLKKGDFLTVIFKDGKIRCLVEDIKEASYGK